MCTPPPSTTGSTKTAVPTKSPPSTWAKGRWRSIRPSAGSTRRAGGPGNPVLTSTSSPARTSRWSTAGSTSPRRAPARKPTFRNQESFCDNTFAKASPRLEKSDHRSNAAVIVGGLRQVQLVQDASHMLLDGAFGKPQSTGDARVGAALRHQRQHLMLPRTKNSKRIFASASGDQLLDERRIDYGAAIGDPLQ